MTTPLVSRALLALLPATLVAPLVTACGALPAGDTLAHEHDPPATAPPPDAAQAQADADPPGRVVRYARRSPMAPAPTPEPEEARAGRKTRTVTVTRPDGVAATVTVTTPAEQVSASAPPPVTGARHLARLHPELRRMARALHAEAAAAGIELKFISGHRAFDRRSAKAKKGRASWHAFGMAFDVNLAHRGNMRDALDHYRSDEAKWARVGAIAERLGLTWGLQWGRHEVFHFEWHPGMPEAIRRPTLTRLLKDAGPDGKAIEKVWRRHWPTDARDDAQGETVAAHDHDHHHD